MAITGEIKNLYSDSEKTKVLIPRTKTKAVTDDNNVSLDVLLEGKAPAGFGLGEIRGKNIKNVDLNTIFENGWYSYNGKGSLVNGPDGYDNLGNYAILEVSTSPYNNGPMTCIQRFTFGAGGLEGYQCQRAYNGSTWLPWCWINPPMIIGREYRTMEQWNNNPVYAMLINCGATAPAASISAPTGATRIIRWTAWANTEYPLPLYDYINQQSYFAHTYLNPTNHLVVMYQADNKSDGYGNGSNNWYVQMWYLK